MKWREGLRTGPGAVAKIVLALAVFFLLLEWQERDYLEDGARVQGVVLEKGTSIRSGGAGGSRPDRWVTYRFSTPDGRQFEGSSSEVLPATWRELALGGPITIEYKRDFPDTNRVAGQVAGAGFWWKAAVVLAAIAAALILVGARRSSGRIESREPAS